MSRLLIFIAQERAQNGGVTSAQVLGNGKTSPFSGQIFKEKPALCAEKEFYPQEVTISTRSNTRARGLDDLGPFMDCLRIIDGRV